MQNKLHAEQNICMPVRAYIDDLLIITKGSHDDHLDKLEQVFIKLGDAGLKVDAAKSFFCMKETKYSG
jgi:hypothetical protein